MPGARWGWVSVKWGQNFSLCSVVSDSVIPWTVTCQAPLSTGFPRQEYWSELPFPPPRDLTDPGIEPLSPTSPVLAGRFFTTNATWEALLYPKGSKMQYSQPASLFKYKLSQAHFSFEARQVCLTPRPSLNHYFVCWDKLKKKRLLGNQNWAKYKSNFDGKNQIKIVIATNYAIWNMQMYSVSCKNACSTLWFFFQMPCFDSTILQYFAEYSMDQKYM